MPRWGFKEGGGFSFSFLRNLLPFKHEKLHVWRHSHTALKKRSLAGQILNHAEKEGEEGKQEKLVSRCTKEEKKNPTWPKAINWQCKLQKRQSEGRLFPDVVTCHFFFFTPTACPAADCCSVMRECVWWSERAAGLRSRAGTRAQTPTRQHTLFTSGSKGLDTHTHT